MNMTIETPALADTLDFVDLDVVRFDPSVANALFSSAARRFRCIVICRVNEQLMVATSHPQPDLVDAYLQDHLTEPFTLLRADEHAVRRHMPQVHASAVSSEPEPDAGGEYVAMCDELLHAASRRGASDIHLVPDEDRIRVGYRIDGALEATRELPKTLLSGLTSRLKVMGGLNIAEKREPQDGRFSWTNSKRLRHDVRVATIPTRFGERVTMRLLTPVEGAEGLADLGMTDAQLSEFRPAMACPNGLILLTGPTGCGKSTTLYTAITERLRRSTTNVITIEDPIEFEIPGASQIEVDAAQKVTFPRALRSILRHDPDVIMVGEIRDAETAELAIKASLTGHLVLSTLHTNTAAGVVTRLLDMGVEPFLVAATLRLSVAQRLVRRLCQHCRAPVQIDATTSIALGDPSLAGQTAYQAVGCVYCGGKGYRGRTALFEMLPGGGDVAERIATGQGETGLLKQMQESRQPRMIDDGVTKILDGTTTTEQVLSAVATW
ncbi:MAG: GspE/PulE family protein [Planctomycetota bacterium]